MEKVVHWLKQQQSCTKIMFNNSQICSIIPLSMQINQLNDEGTENQIRDT